MAAFSRRDTLIAAAAGAIAGSVDIVAASLINRVSPVIVLDAIASGVLGPSAFHNGPGPAAAGLALQFAMSTIIAMIFVIASRHLRILGLHPYVAGGLYGFPVYVVMTWIVVPLSKARPHLPQSLASALPDLGAMILFGLIIGACCRLSPDPAAAANRA